MTTQTFDAVVVGGGPAGATAAHTLAKAGVNVALLDRQGRTKPCGGAIPPRLMRDYDIPEHLLVAHAHAARMVGPSERTVDMPINGGYVGLVDRDVYDPWLRARAVAAGATRIDGTFEALERDADGTAVVCYRPKGNERGSEPVRIRARAVIGADGAKSKVARAALGDQGETPCVFAYHEVVKSPAKGEFNFDPERCDIYYQGQLSPDFYAWIFPHGPHSSIGVGSAIKGFPLRQAVAELRAKTGMDACETVRVEGAPIPLKPLKQWDNGKDVVVAGDAAGVVAPASGEGIYYAMYSGQMAGEAVAQMIKSGDARALASARKRFMSAHGRVFWVLGIMQHYWYSSDNRRERFVSMCDDPDVQDLTWKAYMNKELVRAKPAAHVRIFLKNMGHLLGLRAA
jgi:geranylgeranyl reductase